MFLPLWEEIKLKGMSRGEELLFFVDTQTNVVKKY
jgi:hypothetical protein